MPACVSCGTENPAGARFCNGCGTPLAAAPAPAAPREERRVVTVLFSDLAGFTSRSETLDPEDARALLVPYYAILEAEITGHGGVVERHIGDGIMALFGAPVAHEDDPERAIRAALRILERIPALGTDLHARIGINTGEILYRSEGAGREDAVTGDAANTAARLQGLAPVDGVVVGESTWRATAKVFEYTEHPQATVKGKTEPIRVFQPTAPRARFGVDLTRTHDTPYVGRRSELAAITGAFDAVVATRSPRLVTIVGEPGMGKSRLLAELGRHVEAHEGLVTWRQGRCLPYGDGITFWALGEIVKAHAGILETDRPATASAKLDHVLPEGGDRAWLHQRLLPLVGIEANSKAGREELFTAWRRFLEHVARPHPTVLVFEDLHWADSAMLDFLRHFATRASGVPLLLVGAARPELFGRVSDHTSGVPDALRIDLAPLSDAEAARLVAATIEADGVPGPMLDAVVRRAEGNPLYVEEFVRLLRDRDLLTRQDGAWVLRVGADLPVPESVQALIAARLDALPPVGRALLADAAVMGKVFWAAAIAGMGDRESDDVVSALEELARREFVRPTGGSSMEGEIEYAFGHALIRDVAYGQLPRASRAQRHVAAARWIEDRAAERIEDLADVLAHHYTSALDLARAVGDTRWATELVAPALRSVVLAGERALGLDTGAALSSFERALTLTPPGHPDRPGILARFGEAALHDRRYPEARAALEEAVTGFEAAGDPRAAARALITLAVVLFRLGDPGGWRLPTQALALLEPLPPGPELVVVLTERAADEALQGHHEAGLTYAQRALGLADQLGLPVPARALGFRGLARARLGDPGGLDDMRQAIVVATDAGQGREVAVLHNNVAVELVKFEGPRASLDELRAGIAFARDRGLTEMADTLVSNTLDQLVDTGDYDEALALASRMSDEPESSLDLLLMTKVRAVQALILTIRGQQAAVADSLDWLETTSRSFGAIGIALFRLVCVAFAQAALGRASEARRLLREIDATTEARETPNYAGNLPLMVRIALGVDEPRIAERFATGVHPINPYDGHASVAVAAALAEARGDLDAAAEAYADAADRWERFGVVPEQAFALLGQGRCLLGLGRPTEAATALVQAREIFARLGAAPSVAEADRWLAGIGARS